MSRSVPCILTNMCMITNGTKVLVQDKVGKSWGGVTFPGGHVEQGESFSRSMIREVFEETGLTIESPRLKGIKSWTETSGARYIVLLYIADKFSGELKSSDEGEVLWVEREKLPELKLANGFELMLPVFEDENISEMYWAPDADKDGYELL